MENLTKQKGSYYFEMLTTEEQSNFRNNVIKGDDFSMEDVLNSNFDSFMRFVGSCFSFDESEEGPEYWRDIAMSQRDGVSNEDSTHSMIMDFIKKVVGPASILLEDVLPDLVDESNKTGQELLSEMDEEYATEWRKEFLLERAKEINSFLKMRYKSISQMLQCSFSFSTSEKGRDYWRNVCDLYDSKSAIEDLINDLGLKKQDESN